MAPVQKVIYSRAASSSSSFVSISGRLFLQKLNFLVKKFGAIMVLMIFLNFTALPGIAAVFGFEIPQTNVTVSEEEHGGTAIVIYEKAIPKTLNIHDFLKFILNEIERIQYAHLDDGGTLSPYFSIPSPPPEA